jgi:hypothetical protein
LHARRHIQAACAAYDEKPLKGSLLDGANQKIRGLYSEQTDERFEMIQPFPSRSA